MIKNNYSVLYVENDLILKEKYLRFLRLFFKNVYEASNGQEALEKYYIYKPDVAILAINIPKKDRIAVAKEIREIDENIMLIMLTAYSNTSQLLDAKDLNLFKYLIKPMKTFELEDLFRDTIIKIKSNL